jgi:hypothetical protein
MTGQLPGKSEKDIAKQRRKARTASAADGDASA